MIWTVFDEFFSNRWIIFFNERVNDQLAKGKKEREQMENICFDSTNLPFRLDTQPNPWHTHVILDKSDNVSPLSVHSVRNTIRPFWSIAGPSLFDQCRPNVCYVVHALGLICWECRIVSTEISFRLKLIDVPLFHLVHNFFWHPGTGWFVCFLLCW